MQNLKNPKKNVMKNLLKKYLFSYLLIEKFVGKRIEIER